jgi:hypothetical protein
MDMGRFDVKVQQSSRLLYFANCLHLACRTGRANVQSLSFVAMYRALFISIDGLHTLELAINELPHPSSALVKLNSSEAIFKKGSRSALSNYFRNLLPLVVGSSPISTGVRYEGTYA